MAGSHYKTSGAVGTDPETGSGGWTTSAPSGKGIAVTAVKPPSFTLTPGKAKSSIFIEYTSGTGIKLFNSEIEKLT